MNSRSAKGLPSRRRTTEKESRATSGVRTATGTGVVTERGNQNTGIGKRPDRVAPDRTKPRAARTARGNDPAAERNRDAIAKGADPDAVSAKPAISRRAGAGINRKSAARRR